MARRASPRSTTSCFISGGGAVGLGDDGAAPVGLGAGSGVVVARGDAGVGGVAVEEAQLIGADGAGGDNEDDEEYGSCGVHWLAS